MLVLRRLRMALSIATALSDTSAARRDDHSREEVHSGKGKHERLSGVLWSLVSFFVRLDVMVALFVFCAFLSLACLLLR